ncbi:MAG: zf-HC2 domain-containing protein [Chloroflexaceae bacterium]|jgi:anti-sigma factor RsiW|nr:zf-HC2 domain-containing protein [Chloroflexaceae bacterium]
MNEQTELTCRELVELVTEYVEGAMPPEELRRFEQHLAMCEGCRAYLDQARQTIRLVGQLHEAILPLATRQTLLQTFRSWKNSTSTE